jgi:isoquinoline 1-oxidoreductase beta subunit
MEPMNFYANVTQTKVHLVGPIQTPAWTVGKIAKLLDRDPKEIHLEMTRMGGGFGRRLYGDFVEEAAEISSLVKKPIKVVFSREDDMAAGTYRPAIKYRIKASLKDGEITGYHLKEAAINGNMYGLIPNFFPAGCIPNYKVSTANHQSNITTGAWRAPYTNFLAFAEQSFFSELADELGRKLNHFNKARNWSEDFDGFTTKEDTALYFTNKLDSVCYEEAKKSIQKNHAIYNKLKEMKDNCNLVVHTGADINNTVKALQKEMGKADIKLPIPEQLLQIAVN